MSVQSNESAVASDHVVCVMGALRRYAALIVVVGLVCGIGGGILGKKTTAATSTAQLLVAQTPIRETYNPSREPLTYSAEYSAIARMISGEIGVKTAEAVFTSDEVMAETYKQLKGAGKLTDVPATLNKLRSALTFEIVVDKDTPQDVEYSPLVLLHASASNPRDAAVMVNTWADVCVSAAEEFQRVRQEPSVTKLAATEEELNARMAALEAQLASGDEAAGASARLRGELTTLRAVVADVRAKHEYAKIGRDLAVRGVYVLNYGAEWAMPRYRRAILFGVAGGFWGLVLGAVLAVGYSLVRRPAEGR